MREYRICNIRAIAILIVVFGHSIIMYSSVWPLHITDIQCHTLDYVKRVINLIQMPLFFSLSGYLFYYSVNKKKNKREFITGKANRLLVPYLSIALLWMIPIKLLAEYPNYINKSISQIFVQGILLGRDNGHLWYLPTLFIIFIIAFISFNTLKRHMENIFFIASVLIISVMLLLLSNKIKALGVPYLSSVASYFVWFYLGYVINWSERHLQIQRKKIIAVIFIIFVAIISWVAINIQNSKFDIVASVLWVLIFYYVIPDKENKILKFLSKNSFGLYLFHSPFIYITRRFFGNYPPVFTVCMNFIIFGGISILLTVTMRKLKIGRIIGEF